MPVPKEFEGKITDAQWDKLALSELDADDRESVLDALREGIAQAEDAADVREVVSLAQEAADMFREEFEGDGYDETEINAGKTAADGTIDEVGKEE